MADQTLEERAEVTMEAIYRHVVNFSRDRDASALRESLRRLEPWLVEVFKVVAETPRKPPSSTSTVKLLSAHAAKLAERRQWPRQAATHFLFKGPGIEAVLESGQTSPFHDLPDDASVCIQIVVDGVDSRAAKDL